mgnify:CR=1 FL=1
MKAALILLSVLIVSLLNAGNPVEEASSKRKNAEVEYRKKQLLQTLASSNAKVENRKKQLIETLANSGVKLYYEKDLGKLPHDGQRHPVYFDGEKITGIYVKFSVVDRDADGWSKGEKYIYLVVPYINGRCDGEKIWYNPDATIYERDWYEKGVRKKTELYDRNGTWIWRVDEDGKTYENL